MGRGIVNYGEQIKALTRLGTTREAMLALPQITPQLREITKTLKRAGQSKVIHQRTITHPDDSTERKAASERVVESHMGPYGPGADLLTSWPLYLSALDNADARKLVAAHESTTAHDCKVVPIEGFCAAVGVSPLHILELLVGAIVRQGAQASTIIVAVNHPRIVQKTVEMALTDGGIADRDTLHKAVNFLPTPKGNTTIINNAPSASASASAHAAAASAPPPEQTIRRLSDRFNEARLQNAQPVAALPEAVVDAPAIPVSAARFGDAPARFAVPSASRITEPAPPSVAEFADAEDDE